MKAFIIHHIYKIGCVLKLNSAYKMKCPEIGAVRLIDVLP